MCVMNNEKENTACGGVRARVRTCVLVYAEWHVRACVRAGCRDRCMVAPRE